MVAVLLTAVCPGLGFGQAPERSYDRFRLLLETGERLEGRDLTLRRDSLLGTTRFGDRVAIPVDQVASLDAANHSRAVEWGLAGAVIGAVTAAALYWSSAYSPDGTTMDGGEATGTVLGVGLTAGAIGFFVGSRRPAWQRVRLDP